MTVLHVHSPWQPAPTVDLKGALHGVVRAFWRRLAADLAERRRALQNQRRHPAGREVPPRLWNRHSALLAEARTRGTH